MKKITLTAILIIGVMLSTGNHAKAQNQKGEFVASAGAGYSVLFAVISSLGSSSANVTNGTVSISTIPEINTTADYGLSDKFSLGLGIGYQSATISVNGFNDTANGYTNQNASVSISRLNIGIRPIFHFGSNPNIDFYLGFRVGVSIWSFGVSSTDPNYSFGGKFTGALPSFQALIGLKGYFSPLVGGHIEFAIGTPYLIEAGVSFRFGVLSK
jgi:hypothetical protein